MSPFFVSNRTSIRADRWGHVQIKAAVERFAEHGAGKVKKLQGIDPPEFRLRVGDFGVRFQVDGDTLRILRVLNRKDAYR